MSDPGAAAATSTATLETPHPPWPLVRALRPRQWVKNVLAVGAPVAAGRMHEPRVVVATGVAVLALCLASSATYLVNDLHDRDEDREHPSKRHRPVASGAVSVRTALVAAVVLAAAALAVASFASVALVAVVAAYLALTTAYTLRLRREPVVEMVVVAAGFVLRGASGGAAAGIGVSSWFLLVAGFGSLFLVSGKRFGEITRSPAAGRATMATYSPGYLRFVWTGAATLTVVVYLLWANQVYSVRDDGTWAFWSLVPFVLAVLRYALEVDRGAAEAPEDVALHDRTLQVLALVWLVMVAVGAAGVD